MRGEAATTRAAAAAAASGNAATQPRPQACPSNDRGSFSALSRKGFHDDDVPKRFGRSDAAAARSSTVRNQSRGQRYGPLGKQWFATSDSWHGTGIASSGAGE